MTLRGGRIGDGAWYLHCRGVLLIWKIEEQGPAVLAVGAVLGGFGYFLLSSLFPALLKPVRYKLTYCLKGLLNTKFEINQPVILILDLRKKSN